MSPQPLSPEDGGEGGRSAAGNGVGAMPWVKVLFRSVGEALCAHGLRALAGAVPFGTVVYDVAACAVERFRVYQGEEEARAILQEAVHAALDEVKEEARAVAAEVCAGHP